MLLVLLWRLALRVRAYSYCYLCFLEMLWCSDRAAYGFMMVLQYYMELSHDMTLQSYTELCIHPSPSEVALRRSCNTARAHHSHPGVGPSLCAQCPHPAEPRHDNTTISRIQPVNSVLNGVTTVIITTLSPIASAWAIKQNSWQLHEHR